MFYSIKFYNKYYIAYFTILDYFLTFQKKKNMVNFFYHDITMIISW